EAAEKMGPRDRMSVEELDEALGELHSQGWLLRLGRGEQITYKVNLRRKRGSSLAGSLWDKLGSESESEGEEQKEEPRDAE
ncbi:MAG: hypothetical protein R3272_11405, partial [Candidatus Promineifilaceae bacterium]|nr:hypothetical protein [Candidatus Promineifilaceae bacterium]